MRRAIIRHSVLSLSAKDELLQNWEFALKKMELRRIAPLSKLRISHFPRAIPCDNLVKINIEGFSQAFIAGPGQTHVKTLSDKITESVKF